MGKKPPRGTKRLTMITFIALFACIVVCLFGLLLSLFFAPKAPPANVNQPPLQSTLPPEPTAVKDFGNRSIMVTVFTVKQNFTNWESFGDYEQGHLRNGQATAIFHDDPVTKASLVINRGVSNGGQLIGQLIAVTDTDPAAMDWITRHLNGGGETTIGHTHIQVDDDAEASRVIIEFTFAP